MASQVDEINPNDSHSPAWIPCHQSASFTESGPWSSWFLLSLTDLTRSLTRLEKVFLHLQDPERSLRGSEPAPGLRVDVMDTQGRGRDAGRKESSRPALGWGGRRAGILGGHSREGPLRAGPRRVTRGDEWSLWLRGTPSQWDHQGPRVGGALLCSPPPQLTWEGGSICGDCLGLTVPPTPAEGPSDFTGRMGAHLFSSPFLHAVLSICPGLCSSSQP